MVGRGKGELKRKQESQISGEEIEAAEIRLFEERELLGEQRGLLEQTLLVCRDANEQFATLIKCFTNLGKCAEEFEDQQLGGRSEEGVLEPKVSYRTMKQLFNLSGEQFESLNINFTDLVKLAESALEDLGEVIETVDTFIKGKDDMVASLIASFVSSLGRT